MRATHANLLLVGCAAIWGMSFLFQKTAMQHVPALQFIAARCALAALVLVPFALMEKTRASRPRASTRQIVQAGLLAGVVLFVAAWLQQHGIASASVTNSAFLTSLYVIVTPFLAWALLGQRPVRTMWPAVGLSALGAWLLGGGPSHFGSGDLFVFVATLFWALHIITLGRAAPLDCPIAITAIQFAVSAVLAATVALATQKIELEGLARSATEIAYVGIMSGALTFTIFTMALRSTTATAATVIASTEAPFAALGAYLILGEKLSFSGILGAVLMVAAALVMHVPIALRASRASSVGGDRPSSTGR